MMKNNKAFLQIVAVLNDGCADKALRIAKKSGIKYAMVSLGHGHVTSKLLAFLELDNVHKEILMMVAEESIARETAETIAKEMKMHKPLHGIVFLMPLNNFISSKSHEITFEKIEEGENLMYHAIHVIVDRGKADEVLDIAQKAGSRGGTIFNARGSSTEEMAKILSFDIQNEKEIILILTKREITENVIEAISSTLNFHEPGSGILFVQDVIDTFGIYEDN